MKRQSDLRVRVEFKGDVFEFEGTLDEVFKALNDWFSKFAPAIEAISNVIYVPNLAELGKSISELVFITSNAIDLSHKFRFSTADAICLCLSGAYFAEKVGRWTKGSLTRDQLVLFTRKNEKDVARRISDLKKLRLIEPKNKDEYCITDLGIKEVIERIAPKYKAEK